MQGSKQSTCAIITGSSRGIGAATAKRLAAAGHAVTINYLNNTRRAEELAREIHAAGGRAFPFQADVADFTEVEEMVEETVKRFGRIQIVVNNAGFSQHCTPWARIINICSLRAMTGSSHGAHYAAAKSGLIGLTKSLALELAPSITVNAISPGYTNTDMNAEALATKGDAIRARIPVKRVAEPEEIAALVAFLASQQAGYITGETVNANGGIYMQ
jgi:3-oxoacyl-[acyl-carrier protein] reductase